MSDDPNGSIGAYRVRESFNPSADSLVDKIKRHTADLIDLCQELKIAKSTSEADAEQSRLAALAQTYYEMGAMWAVKAATTSK